MNNDITIGSLAKLAGVSTHQIRYFEEKKILFPKYIDSNGYRMYGVTEINRLFGILYLRTLDLSVSEIRSFLKSNDNQHVVATFQKIIPNITNEIQRLEKTRRKIKNTLDLFLSIENSIDKFVIKQLPERYLYKQLSISHSNELTAQYVFDNFQSNPSNFPLFDIQVIKLSDEINQYICVEVDNADDAHFILKSGPYLCFSFLPTARDEFNKYVKTFMEYAEKNSYSLIGKLVYLQSTEFEIMHNLQEYTQLQMLINLENI